MKQMEVTLEQLVVVSQAPTHYLEQLALQPMSVSAAIGLRRLILAVRHEMTLYEETRKALCTQYGTLDPERRVYQFGEREGEFREAFRELLEQRVEVPDVRFDLDQLSQQAVVSAAMLDALHWLFLMPEEASSPNGAGNSN